MANIKRQKAKLQGKMQIVLSEGQTVERRVDGRGVGGEDWCVGGGDRWLVLLGAVAR